MINETISIIIPIHNTEKYLEQCLDSVLNQTYRDLEIILIDDNSTDRCGELCDYYSYKDPRVKCCHVKAGSAGAARNVGLDMATGAYIGFVDSDDWIEPNMYEEMFTKMCETNAQCVMCRTRLHYQDGRIEETHLFGEKTKLSPLDILILDCASTKKGAVGTIICVWDKLYRRELWENLRFDITLSFAEDRDILFRLAQRINYISLLESVCYNYRRFIGISQDGKLCNECTYIVGYRIFNWAVENRIEHPFYIETVVIHSLGRVRASVAYHDRERYYDTYHDFNRNWKRLKTVLPGSRPIVIVLSYALRFVPHILWGSLCIVHIFINF